MGNKHEKQKYLQTESKLLTASLTGTGCGDYLFIFVGKDNLVILIVYICIDPTIRSKFISLKIYTADWNDLDKPTQNHESYTLKAIESTFCFLKEPTARVAFLDLIQLTVIKAAPSGLQIHYDLSKICLVHKI